MAAAGPAAAAVRACMRGWRSAAQRAAQGRGAASAAARAVCLLHVLPRVLAAQHVVHLLLVERRALDDLQRAAGGREGGRLGARGPAGRSLTPLDSAAAGSPSCRCCTRRGRTGRSTAAPCCRRSSPLQQAATGRCGVSGLALSRPRGCVPRREGRPSAASGSAARPQPARTQEHVGAGGAVGDHLARSLPSDAALMPPSCRASIRGPAARAPTRAGGREAPLAGARRRRVDRGASR